MRVSERRLSQARITGLPLTILLAAIVYFTLIYVTSVLSPTRDGVIVRLDMFVSQALSRFRTPPVIGFFSIVTAFGYWKVVFTLAIAASFLSWLNGRARYIAAIWIVLLGNQATVTLIKTIFARVRPDLAYYAEASYSFPSGHAAISVAFYGFLTCILIRQRTFATVPLGFAGLAIIFLIGSSRLVLDEHYLSDVLNGYLVGALWLMAGIWGLGHVSDAGNNKLASSWRMYANGLILLIAVVVVCILVAQYRLHLVILHPASTTP